MKLTARQSEVLGVIQACIDTNGYPPTVRQLGDKLGIRSTNGVIDHLKALERKGAIETDRFTARGMRIVKRRPFVRVHHSDAAVEIVRRGNQQEITTLVAEALAAREKAW